MSYAALYLLIGIFLAIAYRILENKPTPIGILAAIVAFGGIFAAWLALSIPAAVLLAIGALVKIVGRIEV